MNLLDLAVFYLLLGLGACALTARRGRRAPVDLALTLVLWPLVTPVVLAGEGEARPPGAPGRADEPAELLALRRALAEVSEPQLAALLPTAAQLGPLAARLGELGRRERELDEVLGREEFAAPDEPEVRASLGRLQAMRETARAERAELLTLCRQLRARITVLRFAGGTAVDGDVRWLVAELLGRVDGAQAALDPTA
ncbi:MAG: hypothetical protein EOO75_14505 [Myxococcales bacterium]|nr:MAG: hypothetical protein EOO75_14505 [Myxococcales bacterium]